MQPTTIYYDGLCQLCSREIEMFQRRVTDGRLAYVDIALPNFVAAEHGLDAQAVHETMHVRKSTGELITGVDALIAMWEQVPGFRWLAWLNKFKLIRPFSEVGYRIFAWIRPKLPKRRRIESELKTSTDCETGHCPTR